MGNRIVPDHVHRHAFLVVDGRTEQSWVDLADPLRLEFEYVRRIAEVLEETVLCRPPADRIRVVHVGGGGLTLPRYLAAKRPGTAQVVFEPDAALTEQVRAKLPLPPNSGIKVQPVDGRAGIAGRRDGWADLVISDAFAGASVPGELATVDYFADVARVLGRDGLLVMNLTDSAPFAWAKSCVAGLRQTWPQVLVSAEVAVWKGRRFGNLVALAGEQVPTAGIARRLARAAFPYRVLGGRELEDWLGGAVAFSDRTCEASPPPPWSKGWFS